MTPAPSYHHDWPRALRRYILASAVLHLAWEVVQLPLYSIWSEPISKSAFAVVHCTLGDVMIAGLTLLTALAVLGTSDWPRSRTRAVWLLLLTLGVGYTVYSEWLNVRVKGNWSYTEMMPVIPLLGTGLTPLLQWIVVPTAALWIAVGRLPWRDQPGTA